MALNPIVPGLRRMVNPSHDVAKVALVVASGAELDVPTGVAEQLERQGFREAVLSVPTFTNAAPANEAPKVKKKG